MISLLFWDWKILCPLCYIIEITARDTTLGDVVQCLNDAYVDLLVTHPGVLFNIIVMGYDPLNHCGHPIANAWMAVEWTTLERISPAAGAKESGSTSKHKDSERLSISGQCRASFNGSWLKPATLSDENIDKILDRLSGKAARQLRLLLVDHGNQPVVNTTSYCNRSIRDALSMPVSGRYYYLARGRNEQGMPASQLWEVRHHAKEKNVRS